MGNAVAWREHYEGVPSLDSVKHLVADRGGACQGLYRPSRPHGRTRHLRLANATMIDATAGR